MVRDSACLQDQTQVGAFIEGVLHFYALLVVQLNKPSSLQFQNAEEFRENFFLQLDFVLWAEIIVVFGFVWVASVSNGAFHVFGLELHVEVP